MTDVELGVQGALTCLALTATVLVYAGPYRRARTANWRQDLFAMRNQLWDEMRSRGTLDSEAHRRARRTINSFIRLAPVMNVYFILAVLFYVRPGKKAGQVPIRELSAAMKDRAAAAAIDRTLDEVTRRFVHLVFIQSASGALIGVPIYLALAVMDTLSVAKSTHAKLKAKIAELTDIFGRVGTGRVPAFG